MITRYNSMIRLLLAIARSVSASVGRVNPTSAALPLGSVSRSNEPATMAGFFVGNA